ncbi:YcxB family protein [Geothrix mesophila]|uniref:YcxB family protein n=1 Tax=Geothrix mesophila TaxID=2922723 RepID=UPI001FAE455A|nr:YcxB family protein [Geothrix sp. SG198]
MQILATYTLTPDEALRGTRAFKRLWYALSVLCGALLLMGGLGRVGLTPDHPGPGLFLAFNGLLLMVLPEAVLRWGRRRRGGQAYPPMEVRLDDEGLSLRTEATEGGLPWSAFTRVARRSGFWIFRVGPSQAVLVPERALEGPAAAELEAFLRARKLLRP